MAAPIFNRFATRQGLAEALAVTIARQLGDAIADRGVGLLAVSGGTTPALFFGELSTQQLDWAKVIVTLVDERFVPPSSPRSNAALVAGKLLKGPAAAAQFVPLYQQADSVENAAALAEERLRGLPWPLDAAVLGMGTDGHTASFFPDAANLGALLSAAADQFVLPVHAPSAEEPRLTLTLRAIVSARSLTLHIEGEDKRRVLEEALGKDASLPIRAVFDAARKPIEILWAA